MIVAKCDPAFAKAEGEKLRKAFQKRRWCTSCRRFDKPSEEVVAAWRKARSKVTGIKKTKCTKETDWKDVECDTDDEEGKYPGTAQRSKGGRPRDKALPRGGQDGDIYSWQ